MKKLILTLSAFLLINLSFSQTMEKYKYGFSGFKGGYKPEWYCTKLGDGKRLMAYNQTIPELYAIALVHRPVPIDLSRIEDISLRNKLKILYCYELQVPAELNDDLFSIMDQNLKDQFPWFTASIKKFEDKEYLVIEDKTKIIKDRSYIQY